MHFNSRRVVLGLVLSLGLALTAMVGADAAAPPATLSHFQSDAEFRAFLKRMRSGIQARPPIPPPPTLAVPMVAMPPAPAIAAPADVIVTAQKKEEALQDVPVAVSSFSGEPGQKEDKITNTQEADVDEGDIVKARGDLLVILRRGRLFTVSVAGEPKPIDHIDAYPPGVDASDDWYDEMLLLGDRVVVIGYSYGRGGTEINRFRLSPDGHLTFEDAYQLKSNDYYSDRNYASRLVGNRLIFYSPMYLVWDRDPMEALPALRRWSNQKGQAGFKRIAGGAQVYIPESLRRNPDPDLDTLHTVSDCDLTAPVMTCKATAVLGTDSRSFYVSGRAVYVWTEVWQPNGRMPKATLYRLPFGGPPSAVKARGAPTDQFSFREVPAENALYVLVRSEGGGDAMWRPEFVEGGVALLRLPLDAFGGGQAEARRDRYRLLPRPKGGAWAFQNRFIGDYVFYGVGAGLSSPQKGAKSLLYTAPLSGGPVATLSLPHGIERLEPIGRDGLAIGSNGKDLYFTDIDLDPGVAPRLGARYAWPNATQGESRSHGFFYRPDEDSDSGLMGLPVFRAAEPAYYQLFQTSAAIAFLRRDNRKLSPLGELAARPEGSVDDRCVASCVDWYGNARPIFLRGRVFALMGYELVEGRVESDGIREIGRVNYAPAR